MLWDFTPKKKTLTVSVTKQGMIS